MTILDGFLILIGITIVILCAMEGLLRSFIMLLAFYFIVSGVGAVTLATNAFRNTILTFNELAGGTGVPNMLIAKVIVFTGLVFPMFILAAKACPTIGRFSIFMPDRCISSST